MQARIMRSTVLLLAVTNNSFAFLSIARRFFVSCSQILLQVLRGMDKVNPSKVLLLHRSPVFLATITFLATSRASRFPFPLSPPPLFYPNTRAKCAIARSSC
jgi:hypothetical protein